MRWYGRWGLWGTLISLVLAVPVVAEEVLVWNAVTRVLREGQFVARYLPGQNTGFAYAVATMNLVNGLVSAPHYGTLRELGVAPGADPEDILREQAGICQQAMIVFLAIAEKIGLPAREVAVWYPEEFPEYTGAGVPGHATVEVFYGSGWHWFDPTWGLFYRKPGDRPDAVLSLQEVIALPKEVRETYLVSNQSLLWTQIVTHNSAWAVRRTGYGFLDFKQLRVESPYGTVLFRK
jgi:Transglutaminase-like superfamily